MNDVRGYLASPSEKADEFWESDDLIWIDWREEDESIIEYFNDKLPDAEKIKFRCVEVDKERGVDIFLEKDGEEKAIPYSDECTDRDSTIKSIAGHVSPGMQIRWFMGSLGGDTLAFCIASTDEWRRLEEEFGREKTAFYFSPVCSDSVMFDMSAGEVFKLMEEREKGGVI